MKLTSIIVAIGVTLAAALPTASANAQNARSFVSGQGNDSNNCTLAAPCRTFAVAITRTNAGGEILVLNPAGYGAVTIDKSISIVSGPGVAVSICSRPAPPSLSMLRLPTSSACAA